jgi:hypothetical protein
MKLLHQITGILFIVIFLLTGQYMDFYYPHMDGVGDGTRMMLRSRHIYILLAGLVNLGIGVYFIRQRERWRLLLQLTGSGLLLIAPLLLTGAFFYEPTLPHMPRPLTLPAIVSLLTGTLFHLISSARQNKESAS